MKDDEALYQGDRNQLICRQLRSARRLFTKCRQNSDTLQKEYKAKKAYQYMIEDEPGKEKVIRQIMRA